MKNIFLIITLFCITLSAEAQDKNAKASIEVNGVCEMCKARIEKATLKSDGVKFATWDVDTHMLTLIFDERKTTLQKIQQNIADVGHDTEKVTATEEAYQSVDPCCFYRDQVVIDQH